MGQVLGKAASTEQAKQLIRTAGPCRFKLDTSSSDRLTLSDGRTLGYAQYGDPTGKPVIYLHGLPGARLEAAGLHAEAEKHGLRIISIDRPGYGWSTPNPTGSLLGVARDVKELTEHLELPAYAVLGISGGGPYTLACSYALPADKLKAAVVICGLGPPDAPRTGMYLMGKLGMAYGYRLMPILSAWFFEYQTGGRLQIPDDERLERLLTEHISGNLCPKDAAVLTDVHRMQLYLAVTRQSFAQGFRDGASHDGHLMCCDWGFQLRDIRQEIPIDLWYGSEDNTVPPVHGHFLKEKLGDHATLFMEAGETHASIGTAAVIEKGMLKRLRETLDKAGA